MNKKISILFLGLIINTLLYAAPDRINLKDSDIINFYNNFETLNAEITKFNNYNPKDYGDKLTLKEARMLESKLQNNGIEGPDSIKKVSVILNSFIYIIFEDFADEVDSINNGFTGNFSKIKNEINEEDLNVLRNNKIYLIALLYKNNSVPINLSKSYSQDKHPKLIEYDWYKSIGTIQTFSSDVSPAKVRVRMYIGYKKDDKITLNELIEKKSKIQTYLKNYFKTKTAEELKNIDNEDSFKKEIKTGINDTILTNGKILSIGFDQLDIIQN